MADTYAGTASKKDLHQKALDCFKAAAEAEKEQRERELEQLKFAAGDQWPDDLRRDRAGVNSGAGDGQPPVPARPCLTINKLLQPIQQGVNQMRNAHLALQFAPKGQGASKDTAEVFTDLARAIQVDSRANIAREWAYNRAYRCGRGAYRILTEYANDGDFDLDIVYKRILNQATVYLDPFAQEPDWSDGEWAFVVEDVRWDKYKREFKGKSKLADYTDEELSSIGDNRPGWISGDGEAKAVRVAEYFYIDYGTEYLIDSDTGIETTTEKPDEDETRRYRERKIPRVKWCKLNAVEILEEGDWPGRYIPIIPVIGNEENINGDRRWEGITGPAMDAQRSYNYMRSAQVEAVGLAPRAPWLVVEGQLEGYEAWWNQANTRNFPYLTYKMKSLGAELAPPPTRNVAEPPIQAVTLAVNEADSDIKATTGFFDPSLGNLSSGERSGKAILALQKQQEQGGSGYLNNLTMISMVLEGKILKDLIPKVYDRPGRIVATIGEDDTRDTVMLNQPHMMQDGQPMPVPPGTAGAKDFNLQQGEYSVAVTVGKSYTTKREEAAAAMGDVLSSVPQLFGIVGDLYVKNLDFPGAQQMADRIKKSLPPQLQDSDQSPEAQLIQLQQQAQQAQQIINLLTKELDAKTKIVETDQIKADQDYRIKELETSSREKIALEQINADLIKTEATIAADAALADLKAQQADLSAQLKFLQDAWLGEQERAFQAQQAGMQQGHESVEAEAQRGFDADQAAQQQGHETNLAAMQPPASTES